MAPGDFVVLNWRDAAVVGSRLAGVAKIIAVDIDDRKLATAASLGATHTVNSRERDLVEAVRELTGGFGADVLIEAVGRPEKSTGLLRPRPGRDFRPRRCADAADEA